MNKETAKLLAPLKDFYRARCVLGPDEMVRSVALLQAFDAWTESRGFERIRPRPFAAAMREIGFWPHKRSVMYWRGLRLREDGEAGEAMAVSPDERYVLADER